MSDEIVIIGAGPAGLTAAFELLRLRGVQPIVLEGSGDLGGLSKTWIHHGNRIDFGGHRFFSKSDRVMDWWTRLLPPQTRPAFDDRALGRTFSGLAESKIASFAGDTPCACVDPEQSDDVMLIRNRLSRILFLRQFLNYPLTLDWSTFSKLGWRRSARMAGSYAAARLHPIDLELSLSDFLTNRFGGELYRTFFQDYTEKVWGVPCVEIPAEWGAQRIRGLSLRRMLGHALRKEWFSGVFNGSARTETSLIDRFYYPKYGPGQLWEAAAKEIVRQGGEIHLHQQVTGITLENGRVKAVQSRDARSGELRRWPCKQVFSSMPVKDLIAAITPAAPESVRTVADGLKYRDFITVGLLLKRLLLKNTTKLRTLNQLVPDQWIYVQEPDVKAGRIQIFNNWSPYLVANPNTVWIGIEYFCNEGDEFWQKPDGALARIAIEEMARIGVLAGADVLDQVVLRMPKAYPAYFGGYDQFHTIRDWTDAISNLFLIGRNGMHRYNNMDHSMLTAMEAVACSLNGHPDKSRKGVSS